MSEWYCGFNRLKLQNVMANSAQNLGRRGCIRVQEVAELLVVDLRDGV